MSYYVALHAVQIREELPREHGRQRKRTVNARRTYLQLPLKIAQLIIGQSDKSQSEIFCLQSTDYRRKSIFGRQIISGMPQRLQFPGYPSCLISNITATLNHTYGKITLLNPGKKNSRIYVRWQMGRLEKPSEEKLQISELITNSVGELLCIGFAF